MADRRSKQSSEGRQPATYPTEDTRSESDTSDNSDDKQESERPQPAAEDSVMQLAIKDTLPDSLPAERFTEDDWELTDETEPGIYSWFSGRRRPRSGPQGMTRSARKRHFLYLVFDMRNVENVMNCREKLLPADAAAAAAALNIEGDHILASNTKLQGFRMLVLASELTEKYIFVKTDYEVYCLRIRTSTTTENIWMHIKTMLKKPAQTFHVSEDEHCLFFRQRRLDGEDLQNLPNLAEVKMVQVKPFTFTVIHRWEQFCDKHYILKCSNVDSLFEMKMKFLSVYREVEKLTLKIELNEIWFTLGDKVLSEELLQEKCGINAFRGFPSRSADKMHLREAYIQQMAAERESRVPFANIYVHFQPPDSVPVQVSYRPEASRTVIEETVFIVSPRCSPEQLRREVAKVVRQVPNSIRILLGKKKVDDKLDLQKKLMSGRQCTVTVEQKPKITLRVKVEFMPMQDGPERDFTMDVYSYDAVIKIKERVCTLTSGPQHKVDIYFGGNLLQEDSTLSQNRLRDKDEVKAVVLTNRVVLKVRSTGRRWLDIVVDDCLKTTVGDVKRFLQSPDHSSKPEPECEVVAICGDTVPDDSAVLGDNSVSPDAAQMTFLLAGIESLCFTASSSCQGKFAVFQDAGDGCFHHVLAMSDGKTLFYAPAESDTADKVRALITERRQSAEQKRSQVQGMRLSARPLKEQMPLFGEEAKAQGVAWQRRESTDSATLQASMPTYGRRSKECARTNTDPRRRSVQPKCQRLTSSVRFDTCETDRDTCPKPSTPTDTSTTDVSPTKQDAEDPVFEEPDCAIMHKSQSTSFTESSKRETPIDRRRSKSCPPFPPSKASVIFQTDGSQGLELKSDNDSGYRKDYAITTFQRDSDGNMTVRCVTESEMSVPAHLAEKALSSSSSFSLLSSGALGGAGSGTLLPYESQESPSYDEFRYIKRCIVLKIASHIGRDGIMLARNLGVTQDIIEKAEGKHPGEIVEQALFCLRAWCRKAGAMANKQTLKDALRGLERNDLVEIVDEVDSQTES